MPEWLDNLIPDFGDMHVMFAAIYTIGFACGIWVASWF